MIQRFLNLKMALSYKSLFLFGPMQTGKTTYLKKMYPKAEYFDLLDIETLRTLSHSPKLLEKFFKYMRRFERLLFQIPVIDGEAESSRPKLPSPYSSSINFKSAA